MMRDAALFVHCLAFVGVLVIGFTPRQVRDGTRWSMFAVYVLSLALVALTTG